VLYACDLTWWVKRRPTADEFAGQRWTIDKGAAEEFGLRYAHSSKAKGLGLQCINTGGNSGHQAINLAFLAGTRRIVLLGFDMTQQKGVHWHGPHARGLNNPHEGLFRDWRRALALMATDLAAHGCTVINATRDTALECFPRQPLESIP
jgi:hypothetical protein